MTSARNLTGANWHKSTYSGNEGECVEVAENLPGVVLVRDTKDNGLGHMLQLRPTAWAGFVESCKAGEFDR